MYIGWKQICGLKKPVTRENGKQKTNTLNILQQDLEDEIIFRWLVHCKDEVNGIDILYLLCYVYGVSAGLKIAQLLWLQVCIGIN